MKNLKPVSTKHSGKRERERKVLHGLVEHYLTTGKPVGSKSLQEAGFQELSSATIRNYFARLEREGYLQQFHASGGRIPTALAYRDYASVCDEKASPDKDAQDFFKRLQLNESHEISQYLENAAEKLSSFTQTAVFLSLPRFDHDFILSLKLVSIDLHRHLAIIITDFGVIKTEVLHSETPLHSPSSQRIENDFQCRLLGQEHPEDLTDEEQEIAEQFYNEVMLRYLVGYTNYYSEEICCRGFSQLMTYPDFPDLPSLSNNLSILEDHHNMNLLLRESIKSNSLKFWIGDDLQPFMPFPANASILAVPYYVNSTAVGAIAILGPLRIPYKTLFRTLQGFSDTISEALTAKIYKFKISCRHAEPHGQEGLLPENEKPLIEDQR